MDAARLLETLNHQGLNLFAQGAQLIVKPGNLLTANDETLIRQHQPELLRLLRLLDVETLLHALTTASTDGLAWHEGTPPDWSNDRLLAAGEVLYRDGRMVNVLGRRYLAAQAPRLTDRWSDTTSPQTTPQNAPSAPRSGLVDDREGGHPKGTRIAELIAAGWAPWNAKAVYISELIAAGWSLYDARIQAESEAPTAGGPC